MAITISKNEPHGSWTVLTIAGRLDTAASPDLEEACRAQLGPGMQLALEFSGVSFLCSAGLRVILLITKELGPLHARLVLVDPQPAVRDALQVSGFAAFVPVVASVDTLA